MSGVDQRTIESATAGDQDALRALVADCSPRLHAYVRLHMGAGLRHREASLDVVQSVCREVLEDLEDGFEYRGKGAFYSWVFAAAINKIRERRRYHGRERRDIGREVAAVDPASPPVDGAALSPSHEAMAREDLDGLNRAFARLDHGEQEIITLSRLVGMSHAELGAELDCSADAARMRLGRALARLSALHQPNPD